eukprot:3825382-Alexandrium_andersonii.AAC.1
MQRPGKLRAALGRGLKLQPRPAGQGRPARFKPRVPFGLRSCPGTRRPSFLGRMAPVADLSAT